MILHGPDRRSWLAPEVIQTSAMDCGPAALKCILEGWRIPVSYPRLREACQTDVDGTSIDTLEEVARLLGLEAEQVMLPLDHVLADEAEALPALAVVRLPAGVTHFVVAWRRHGPLVQVMDPATGRRLVAARRFLEELYLHRMPVAAEVWREWAGSDGAAAVLVARMAELGVGRAEAEALVALAGGDPTWRALAEVDAGVRMAAALVRARGVDRGREARALLHALIARPGKIPDAYWTVRPVSGGEDQLLMGGAVLMRVTGRAAAGASLPPDRRPDLPPDLVAALEEPPARPGREILDLVRADGVLAPAAIGAALVVAAGAVLAEAVLFRAFLDLGREIARPGERLAAIAALLAFSVGLLLVELGAAKGVLRAGRRLETRLRAALLERLPRLFDSYFRSRLTSDMAERGHAMHTLREVPDLGARLVRACADLVCTALGIFWIDPHSAPLALLACAVALGVPLALQPMLTDRDLRLRTHIGALTRSTFDALRGTVPIRTHVAGAAVRRAHEGLLAEWAVAGRRVLGAVLTVEALSSLGALPVAAWLIYSQLSGATALGGILLLAYWALNLPLIGQEIAAVAREAARQRNVSLRLAELLGAPAATPGEGEANIAESESPGHASARARAPGPGPADRRGIAIELAGVAVRAGGHTVLDGIDLAISAGCHAAIVGPSGSGKSTLLGLLLGWHQPAHGSVLADGEAVAGAHLEALRRSTAWVDPSIHLWNRSLLDNLRQGGAADVERLDEALDGALLRGVLARLPDGLQTRLGEGGTRLSGGEGQRVRLGRAVLRSGVRLAILDEPFGGLDRDQRQLLLRRARARWKQVTILLVTHDVADTLDLDRVIVLDGGRIIEDGGPRELASRSGSRYAQLLAAEDAVRRGLWDRPGWRRLRLEDGAVVERGAAQ